MALEFLTSFSFSRFMKSLGKKAAKNKRMTIVLSLFFLLFLYLLFDNKGIITRLTMESKREEVYQTVVADSAETRKLQAQIKALEGDRQTIETIAREKYNMARPGETIYRIKKDEGKR